MTILQKLEDDRVVSFRRTSNGIIIEECCDNYFSVELSLEEFDQLLTELAERRANINAEQRDAGSPAMSTNT
jgi:Rad3-related DNA helicase